jgi:DNA-binding HxlR family transcriptional regulator
VRTYGQYCPIARTSELIAERWTPILIRNLLAGCRTFNELLDGAPGMSKALLMQRLAQLEHHGIIEKAVEAGPRRPRWKYTLTEKGRELKTVTDAMGHWGARWLEVEPQHADAAYVLWATCKLVDPDRIPDGGLVARIELEDRPKDRFWLVIRQPRAELCSAYLGWDEDIVVSTDSETLAHYHLRHLTYADAARLGRMRIQGTRANVKSFLGCIRPSPFAGTQPAVHASLS